MKRSREDNTVSVVLRAVRDLRINVTQRTVRESLKSHPHYPSFKSICDAFSSWKVDRYPLRYETGELHELAAPYIAHLNTGGGQLAWVTCIRDGMVTWYESYNKSKMASFSDFSEKCSGAVILIDPDRQSGEKEYRKILQEEFLGKAALPAALLTILAVTIFSLSGSLSAWKEALAGTAGLLLLTKSAGIVLSVLLILHEFEVRLALTDRLCHLTKATNCNTVLNDKTSRIFGWFGWADTGFIFFTGGLIFLFSDPSSGNLSILGILAALSVPYPLFSIYYQGFVLKKWCPMCLGVQFVLLTEFIILMPFITITGIGVAGVLTLLLTFLLTGVLYLLFTLYVREKKSNGVFYSKYLRFKRNTDIFRIFLQQQKVYEIPQTDSMLVFGRRDSELKITVFLSLHCSHCARAFESVRELLLAGPAMEVDIVLMSADNKMLKALYHYTRNGMEDEALKLLGDWYNTEPWSRSRFSDELCIPETDENPEALAAQNYELYKLCEVAGTPTFFINGRRLPSQYEIDDIRYFEAGSREEGALSNAHGAK